MKDKDYISIWLRLVADDDPYARLAKGDLKGVDRWVLNVLRETPDQVDLCGLTVWMLRDSVPRLKFLSTDMRTAWLGAWDRNLQENPGLDIGVRILRSAVKYINDQTQKTFASAILDLNIEERPILGELLCDYNKDHVLRWFKDRLPVDSRWEIPSLEGRWGQ